MVVILTSKAYLQIRYYKDVLSGILEVCKHCESGYGGFNALLCHCAMYN